MNYLTLKAAAKASGRPVTDLLALAPANDPFYSGAPAQQAAAGWFAALFDPAGNGMPVATARQLEFWRPRLAPGLDVGLHHLALTAEQAARFHLPRVPIKETDRRRANFEDANGEGAVELDALEALHPGALARLVRDAVAPYRDETLEPRLADAQGAAEALVRDAWHTHTAPRAEEIRSIRDELHRHTEKLAGRLSEIQRELLETWDPPRLPERPWPDLLPVDEEALLFVSNRDYLTQLDSYRRHRRGREAA